MKRYILSLLVVLAFALGAKAMGYEQARREALYLTDKMAYELNLNDQQYEYAYEINLDYLMGLTTADDIYGSYLSYRNADLRHILYDWQWTLFTAADYFFRPVYWRSGGWYFPIYGYYRTDYYFRSCPSFYHTYRGGHCRDHYHNGWYASRRPHWDGGWRGHDRAFIGHGHVQDAHRGGHYEGGRPSSHDNRGYTIGNRTSYDGNRGNRTSYDGNRGNRGSYDGNRGNRGNHD
ncbi:MAG: hypothetical protein KBT12_02685, partial [Bacteroidales bacterium]|nr:hypothetical protein [Candidatus Physcousia equi]